MFRAHCSIALVGVWVLAACGAVHADLIWEAAGLSDEQVLVSGNTLYGTTNQVTLGMVVFSDSDGGTFDLGPGRNTSYLTYENGITGNHAGYLELSFDNQNNDPADYLELVFSFAYPTTNLQFALLDVDRGAGNSFADGVEVFYNGINIRSNPSLFSFGSSVALDNESYMDGFEGITTSAATSTTGNIQFDFGATVVNSITIRYRSSDDAQGNPVAQFIGVSDLSYTSIPEPVLWGLAAAFGLPLLGVRRR